MRGLLLVQLGGNIQNHVTDLVRDGKALPFAPISPVDDDHGGRGSLLPPHSRGQTVDVIARAKGMSQVACDAGLSRESLYKALSGERNPSLDTVLRVVEALGLKLRAEAAFNSDAAEQGASAYR